MYHRENDMIVRENYSQYDDKDDDKDNKKNKDDGKKSDNTMLYISIIIFLIAVGGFIAYMMWKNKHSEGYQRFGYRFY